LLNPASLTAKAPEVFTVTFTTSAGDIVIEAHRGWAPLGVDRFYNLAKHNFFENAAFFRVIPGFMVQFGLPADPKVGMAWQTANLKDDRVTQSNGPGYVTFATAGPNTRTTQLFINTGDNSRLDRDGFTPFGKVTEGMDVVRKIYSGYGESPDQTKITTLGKAYLDKSFPKLDFIKSTKVSVPPPAAPPAATPAKK
jgi:peptidyl-prolyl cis-trans isomerase A (cyclophilin A)